MPLYVVYATGFANQCTPIEDVVMLTHSKKMAIKAARTYTNFNPNLQLQSVVVLVPSLDTYFSEGILNDSEIVFTRCIESQNVQNQMQVEIAHENEESKKTLTMTRISYENEYATRGYILSEDIDNVTLHVNDAVFKSISLPRDMLAQ